MEDRKITVKNLKGEKVEVIVGYLSAQKKNQFFKDCIKFKLKGNANAQEFEMEEIDMFGLKNKVLNATVQGLDIDNICEEDGDIIYDKFFGTLMNLGGGDSKN